MPLYVYKCTSCTHKRELLVKSYIDQPVHVICEKCSNTMLRDIGSETVNFRLHGSCWAKDGYGDMTHREIMDWNDKDCLKVEKERKKADKTKKAMED